ncbi:uncharacterized protein LOC126701030 [Quercus robur]|uniref:uncharacterized protein LOC126701030 n=1 Tax=Quercus robur TaxID=38942 RepID=UPI0021636DA5|nr:uncharacterized protein LOC126701030 [Quercus robur]
MSQSNQIYVKHLLGPHAPILITPRLFHSYISPKKSSHPLRYLSKKTQPPPVPFPVNIGLQGPRHHRPATASAGAAHRRQNQVRFLLLAGKTTQSFSALGTWVFSVAGALLAIPVGIKRKSLAPLVFFGTTGTMLDIIMGITACEREHAERQMQLLEAQNSAADASLAETVAES